MIGKCGAYMVEEKYSTCVFPAFLCDGDCINVIPLTDDGFIREAVKKFLS